MMTAPNPIPPQVIEKWRTEFERLIPPNKYVKYSRDKNAYIPTTMEYSAMHYDGRWQGFLLARSTVELQLPEIIYEWDMQKDSDEKIRYLDFEDTIYEIKYQGYRVAGEK